MKSLLHFFRHKLRSKLGFSILEVMIVGGLMSIVGLAISTVLTNSNKAQKRLEQKDSQISIAGYIRSALQRDAFCANAFCLAGDTCAGNALTGLPRTAAPGAIAEVELSALQMFGPGGTAQNIVSCRAANNCNVLLATDPAPQPPAVLGTPVPGQPGFFIYGMRLMNIVFQGESPANTQNSSGQLVIKYISDSKNSSGGQLKDTAIDIVFRATNAGVITGCSAGAQDTVWQPGLTTGDIYYDGGEVGIGTIDPIRPLHVVGAPILDGDANTQLRIEDSRAFNLTPTAGLHFANRFNAAGTTAGMGAITVLKENATDGNTSSAMTFHTRLNAGNVTERMRINSAGNVGIGTNNPQRLLHLSFNNPANDGTNGRLIIENTANPGTGAASVGLQFRVGDILAAQGIQFATSAGANPDRKSVV